MTIKKESVRERDIDLLLMHELIENTASGKAILQNLFGEEYALELVQHSRYDETGESDILVIVSTAGRSSAAVFIERYKAYQNEKTKETMQ